MRRVRLGKGYVERGGKVVAKRVPRDAAAARRERPGGSKKVRVARRAVTLEDVLVFEERERAKAGRKRKDA